jgi:integrase
MPTGALTQKKVENLKARDKDYYESDGATGLLLLVRTSGAKTWLTMPRCKGKQVKITIGKVGQLSLKDARAEASRIILAARQGTNVNEEAKKRREAEARAGKDTLAAIWAEYLQREGKKLRSIRQRAMVVERLIIPALGPRQIDSISRTDINRLLDKVEDESGERMADITLAYLRRLLSWYESRSETYRSPIVRTMGRYSATENARTRTLEDHELRAIWRTAETFGTFGQIIRLLLLTAARRNEVMELPWSEITGDVWVLSATRNKTKVDHLVPLSATTVEILDSIPRIVGDDRVFRTGSVAHLKKTFDQACGVTGWRLHDLRRTSRSLLSRAGVAADVGERCLGHLMAGVRKTYDRYSYAAEKRAAFTALDELISKIVGTNVVALRR